MAIAGLITIVLVLVAIMSKRLSALVALITIPIGMSLALGFGLQTNDFIVAGITNIAPVAVMFIFAILFFGIMHDAKVFDPIVNRIIGVVGTDPRKILPGTAVLTAIVHLDGSGASTFLIAIPALKPLYDRLNIDLRTLACTAAMAAGVSNLLPWGGPTIRAASALDIPVLDLYRPLIAVQLTGFAFVVLAAYSLGLREYKRLGAISSPTGEPDISASHNPGPGREFPASNKISFPINIALILLVISSMISGLLQPMVSFMLGVVAALMINFPRIDQQTECINAHAKTALLMASILFAAGVFSGVLKGSGMLQAMAQDGSGALPATLTSHLPIIMGLISMPLSLLFDPDSFYFGILPVMAGIANEAGLPAAHVAQGALLGQMTTGFAVSPLTPATFLLVGLTGIDLADHQRFTIPFLLATSWVMTLACLVYGVFLL